MKLLDEEGVDFERVNYFIDPLSRHALVALLGKGDLRPRDVLRKGDKAYKELGLGDESVTDDALIDALVLHPGLLQRPIVERGDRAVLGRPIENVRLLMGLPR